MSSFATTTTAPVSTPPDPSKHVNYSLGMVLGVDDFTQEFAYLSGRDQWLARDVIGYGTVCGLKVHVESDATQGPRVSVSAGVALSPAGQLLRVTREQCASLNDWIAAHKTELLARLSSPPTSAINLYVVLCYRACPTDNVPIPGEPCRSEDEAMAPSRWADDFKLELRFDPPEQREEDALRDFIAWLRQVEITSGSTTSLENFIAAIKDATLLLASPPSSPPASPPDFMHGSPPLALDIPAERACEYLRAAFRIWATELRPLWMGTGQSCGTAPNEECLLLAELNVPLVQVALTGEWRVDDGNDVVPSEERRPYLIHLRMLQELLLCGRAQALNPSDTVVAETTFGLAPSAGTSLDYSRANHTHGTPLDPIPGHQADANAHTLAGDVTGAIGNTTVERIRNVTVAATTPTTNQVLTFRTGQWRPTALPALNGEVTGSIANNTVAKIQAVPVAPPPGAIVDGQVLTIRTGRWQAAPLPALGSDFVEHPPGLPRYAIVAAGIVRHNGNRPPVYNGLFATASGPSELTVNFNGYTEPAGAFQYIIKVLAVFNDIAATPVVTFVKFNPTGKGFILRVTNGAAIIPQNNLARLEFMIEVSQYF